ncbi:MAG: DUF3623 domain-containing protein [Alphaproteobacteria bacterium]|nr:DUF3623 domain-containing protein [Alphaproteobacteria bacterium]
MSTYVLPAIFAAFLWWLSTGVIVYLDHLPRWTFGWSLLGASGLAIAAIWGLVVSAGDNSLVGAYCGFACALFVWAWVELSFYSGWVTGIHNRPCPPGRGGWERFRRALAANFYHELAIVVLGAAVVAATWGATNRVGLWTFVLLAVMHESARLNVLLGVGNFDDSLLPDHLRFMRSFIACRPINLLFPVSVTGGTVLAGRLIERAASAPSNGIAAAMTFLATMTVLAVLEHWVLVLPLPSTGPWQWGLRGQGAASEPETATETASATATATDDPVEGGNVVLHPARRARQGARNSLASFDLSKTRSAANAKNVRRG